MRIYFLCLISTTFLCAHRPSDDPGTNYRVTEANTKQLLSDFPHKSLFNDLIDHSNRNKKNTFENLFGALERARKSNQVMTLFGIYSQLGEAYYTNNDYVSALRYFDMALNNFKGQQTDTAYLRILARTGTVQGETGNTILAYNIFKKVLGRLEKSGQFQVDLSYKYYNNLANELYRLNKIDQAASYYEKSLTLSQRYHDSVQAGKSLFGLSRIEIRKENFGAALELAKRCIALLSGRHTDPKTQMICSLNLSHIYIRQKQYAKARKEAESVFHKATLNNELKILMDAAFHLKTITAETGDFSSAYQYQEIHAYLKDSLFNLNKKLELFTRTVSNDYENKIKQDSLRYVSERTRLGNDLKLKELKRSSNQIIFLTVALGVIAVLMFYFYSLKKNREKQKMEYEKKLSEAKMSTLITQINPHFVFNSLNSILSFIQNSNDAVSKQSP
ncbi:MAG: hypothetical protein K0S12_1178 [Bacteroidetes bacterium]|nr:hypothetical protein [Bacteroidota bacterium]